MAKARIEFDEAGIRELLQSAEIRDHVMGVAENVKSEAESTAVAAEQGSKRLAGYADAGFRATWEPRGKRPRAVVESLAPEELYLRVFISTARNLGRAHILAALYKYAPKQEK